MAISPPGDLVLDVIRAADPAQVEEARRALLDKRAAEPQTAFEAGFERPVGSRFEPPQSSTVPDSYRDFEALVLQTFLQSMWPADSEATFGKGTAGDMWKGLMSEHLGRAMADSGGIGIAGSWPRSGPGPPPASRPRNWPAWPTGWSMASSATCCVTRSTPHNGRPPPTGLPDKPMTGFDDDGRNQR